MARSLEFTADANERKQDIMSKLEELREGKSDELLSFWHKLMAEEAELIYELKAENQILQTIMGAHSLSLAGASVASGSVALQDDTAATTDDHTDDNDAGQGLLPNDDEVVVDL